MFTLNLNHTTEAYLRSRTRTACKPESKKKILILTYILKDCDVNFKIKKNVILHTVLSLILTLTRFVTQDLKVFTKLQYEVS